MKIQTLHCEAGNHEWERPSQRGKKPKNCPEHKPQAVVTPVVVERDDAPDPEVVDLYLAERPGEDRNIIAAFVYAGIEPPLNRNGFTYAQEKIVRAYYDRFDPNGSKLHASKLNEALAGTDA